MTSHFELSDAEFERQFRNCSLDPSLFTHEAHLRLAWIYIRQYGVDKAIEQLCDGIRRFAESIGAHTKFNTTVTVASVRAVNHFILRSGTNNFSDFIVENDVLTNDFRRLISSHYKTDIFKSERARAEFIQPELLPFD